MIDTSAAYGLYNPAFTDDIGTSAINRMYPSNTDMDNYRVAGTDFSNIDIQKKLMSDTVDFKKKQKTQNIITGVVLGAGVLALGALGLKFGKPIIGKIKPFGKKIVRNIKKLFSKGGPQKAWNYIKKVPGKVWRFTKSIPTKIKNIFK